MTIGLQTLKNTFPDLSSSTEVGNACRIKPPQKALERIERYLDRLEKLINDPNSESRLERRLLNSYCLDIKDKNLVLKLAKGIFELENRLAIKQGRGADIESVSFEQVKNNYTKLVHEKCELQKSTLSNWISYLKTNQDKHPTWFRYLVLRELKKMGNLKTETASFRKRTSDTIASFPEINHEAIGFAYRALTKELDISKYSLEPEQINKFRELQQRGKFSVLYGFGLVELSNGIDRKRTNGIWVKYNQGSNFRKLENDLAGKGTGWCTATGTAEFQLEQGDFYVYYTENHKNEFNIPRVAISMVGDRIEEIKGINTDQELEPEFLSVAENKGKTLGGYARFAKATQDMRLFNEIYDKCFKENEQDNSKEYLNPILSKEELIFLYQLNDRIQSFGNTQDPRIKEILGYRDKVGDFITLGYMREQIAETTEQITKDTKVFLCLVDLQRKEKLAKEIFSSNSPLYFFDNVNCYNVKSITSIPAGSVFIGDNSFCDCESLTSIGASTVFHGRAEFFDCISLRSINDATIFYSYALFKGCTALKSIGKSVLFNLYANFENCTALTSIGRGSVFNGSYILDMPLEYYRQSRFGQYYSMFMNALRYIWSEFNIKH